jgi:hypothetical protein
MVSLKTIFMNLFPERSADQQRRVARFFMVQKNRGKCSKIARKIPNDHSIYQNAQNIPIGHKNSVQGLKMCDKIDILVKK